MRSTRCRWISAAIRHRRCWKCSIPSRTVPFGDHYFEVDFDLSDVMFVCTANSMNIPAPLLDRMEVIRIPGYTEDEKLNIAKRYLIPKQMEANGLKPEELAISDSALRDVCVTTRVRPVCVTWSAKSPRSAARS